MLFVLFVLFVSSLRRGSTSSISAQVQGTLNISTLSTTSNSLKESLDPARPGPHRSFEMHQMQRLEVMKTFSYHSKRQFVSSIFHFKNDPPLRKICRARFHF